VDAKQPVDDKTVDTVQPSSLSNHCESQNEVKCDTESDIKEHERKTSEVKTCSQGEQKEIDKNNSDKTNNSNEAPVAPPRRKKKNKKQADKNQVNIAPVVYYIFTVNVHHCQMNASV
jgi:hypothetical protein